MMAPQLVEKLVEKLVGEKAEKLAVLSVVGLVEWLAA
jgi:hypothetical protein